MIAKHVKGTGARGLAEYLTASTDHKGAVRPTIVDLGGTLPGQNPREIARAMGALHALRPTVSRYVAHAMLRWDAASGDAPDLAAQADMMTDHMHALGFEDFRIWSHGTEVHAMASRIRTDGGVVSEKNDWRAAEQSCRALEIKYGLRRLASSPNADPERAAREAADPKPAALTRGEMGMAHRAVRDAERQGRDVDPEALPSKPQLADAVLAAREVALRDGATVGAFVRACRLAGVEVRPNWSPESGRVSGFSFFLADRPEVEVSASKISRSLSWANLLKGGLSYEFDRDGAELRTASERAESIRSSGKAGGTPDAGNPELGGARPGIPAAGGDAGGPAPARGSRAGADGRHAGPDAERVESDGTRDERGAEPVAGGRGDEHGGAGREAGGSRGGDGASGLDVPPQAGRGGGERQPDREGVEPVAGRHGEPGPADAISDQGHAGGRSAGRTAEAHRPAVDGAGHGPAHERLVSVAGVEDDRLAATLAAVGQAVQSLGESHYVVGILPPRGLDPEQALSLSTIHRTYTAEQLVGAPVVKYLRHMNARGHDIYVKPAGTGDGTRPPLVLLDDLKAEAVARMRRDGVAPCLEVTSSPGNHQAWVRVGAQPMQTDTLRQIARDLAARYGADPMAAKGEQFGRLPGFTNRKPKRIVENGGKPPFARVVDAAGRVAARAAEIVAAAAATLREAAAGKARFAAAVQARAEQRQREREHEEVSVSVSRHMRASAARMGGGGSLSEVDFAAACGALRDGHDPEAIKSALRDLSPDLERRHPRVDDYLNRTLTAAEAAVASGLRR